MMAASPTSPGSPFSPCREVIFQSYLHKTPPLDRLFVKWKRRWFVLSRPDPYDHNSLDLSYYADKTMKEKKGTINLTKFVGIRPNARIGNKEFVFAIETEERKYILRAADLGTKNTWLAKLCELCGQEQVFHVSVPNQPSAEPGEGILKLSNQTSICIISPSSGKPLLEIPFRDIRRLGCLEAYGHDLVWIETCKSCRGSNNVQPNQFYFFVVPSGPTSVQLVTKDLKIGVERCTGVFLILEETDQTEVAYISRDHYGCAAYPLTARNRIIHLGITQGSSPWNSTPPSTTQLVHSMHHRPSEPVLNCGLSLEEYATAKPSRRGTFTVSNLPPAKPHHPQLHRGMTTLDRFRKASLSSVDSHSSLELTDGNSDMLTPVSDVFEPVFNLPNGSPPHKQSISHTDSLSSRGSGGSSSPIAEEPEEEDEEELRMHPLQKRSRSRPELRAIHNPPYIPPRSPASLIKLRARTPSNK